MTNTSDTGPAHAMRPVNPTTWSQALGFDQGQIRVRPTEILTIAGQGPLDAAGRLLHEDDPTAQLALAFSNVVAVLTGAGMTMRDLAHVRLYVTDIEAVLEAYDALVDPLTEAGCRPPSTLVEVNRLAVPGMTVEIDAIAIR